MTVTPTPPPAGAFATPQSGGYRRAFVIGCGVIFVLGLVAVVALYLFVFTRNNLSYDAYTRAASDPRVIAMLGTPIERGWWNVGTEDIDGGTHTASSDFQIAGPKGKARVHVAATRENNRWSYSSLVVRPAAGGEIDVLHH